MSIWGNPEAVAMLRRLWNEEGATATEIADKLNRAFPGHQVNRNKVLSKVHRSAGMAQRAPGGNTGPRGPRRPPVPRERAPRPRSPKPRALKPAPVSRPVAPRPPETWSVEDLTAITPLRVAPLDLEDHHCKWPIGDPAAPGFCHCGLARFEGQRLGKPYRYPYCEFHAGLAYQAGSGK